jgi:hypothetical protein
VREALVQTSQEVVLHKAVVLLGDLLLFLYILED